MKNLALLRFTLQLVPACVHLVVTVVAVAMLELGPAVFYVVVVVVTHTLNWIAWSCFWESWESLEREPLADDTYVTCEILHAIPMQRRA